jgi:hypothetical protein
MNFRFALRAAALATNELSIVVEKAAGVAVVAIEEATGVAVTVEQAAGVAVVAVDKAAGIAVFAVEMDAPRWPQAIPSSNRGP